MRSLLLVFAEQDTDVYHTDLMAHIARREFGASEALVAFIQAAGQYDDYNNPYNFPTYYWERENLVEFVAAVYS